MRFSFTALFIGTILLSAGAYSQNTLLDIELKDASAKRVFKEIKKQSEFTFVYNVDDIETLGRFDYNFKESTVDKILNHCFARTNITYEIRDKVIIIFPKEKRVRTDRKYGEINGYIHDEAGEPMAYANVQLMGTASGTISDNEGFYSIQHVPLGTYELRVTFVGYSENTATVQVSAGGVTSNDFRLTITSIQGEEVVVTTLARGQARAINTQLAAKNITNVVSEQKIRELPDANAAEALARLPGVSVLREGGEAVAIKVRGDSANTMYVNGMRMDGGLGSISSSMIGGIELSKTFMADQDADVLGGNVEFKMREALPGFRKDIWVRTGYNGFTNSFKMQDLSLLLSNRFFNDRLGVMLSLNYDRKDRGRDVVSATYMTTYASPTGSEDILAVELNSVTLNHSQNLNNRYGATVYTDFRLKSGKLYYQAFISQLNSENYSSRNTHGNSACLGYNATYHQGFGRNFLQGLGGEHTLLGAKVEWGVSMSDRKTEIPEELRYNAWNMSGRRSGPVRVDSSTTISEFLGFAHHDLKLTEVYELTKSKQADYSDELAARLDVEVPFRLGSKIVGYLKFGGKVRDMKRGLNCDQNVGSLVSHQGTLGRRAIERLPDFGWTFSSKNEISHEAFTTKPNVQDFSMLGARTYFFPDFDKVEYILDTVVDLLRHKVYGDLNNYTNTQRNYAGYIMAGIDIGEIITFMPGVRYERYDYTTTAKRAVLRQSDFPFTARGEIRDTTAGHFNEQFFPMFHLKIKPVRWFDIRLAATKTLARPAFTQMSPRYTRFSSGEQIIGDPYLKPQTNYNYDIYFSFYTGKTGLFTIGAFYKKLTDQVLDYTVRIIDAEEQYGLDPIYEGKKYSKPLNNQWPGYVQGLELDWQTHFSFLPTPFNGILLNMNLTYMQSETRYPFYSFYKEYLDEPPYVINVGQHDSRVNTVIGMPDMIANVVLGYELGGCAGRISAYYQGATITEAQASNKSLDEDKDALLRLDMQLSQKFKKVPGLVLYLNINNMTNNPDRMVLTYHPDKLVREEMYGVSGDVGVRYKF